MKWGYDGDVVVNAVTAKRYLTELKDFVRFPSVSTQPGRYGVHLRSCAAWLARHLQKQVGLNRVQMYHSDSYPIVTGECMSAGPGAPTILVYGHYDVQPPEPFDQWQIPPFQPTIRNQYLYGRGASDDKGQLFIHLKAMEYLLRRHRKLPVNVRCIFEGAEEIGSPGLAQFLQTHKERLKADVAILSDSAMPSATQPAIAYGMRGVLYVELSIWHNIPDLHSGNFGGVVRSPLEALCQLVGNIFDESGRISVPGFYDGIWPPTPEELEMTSGQHTPSLLQMTGEFASAGDTRLSAYERVAFRPSITVSGLCGGYNGPGLKAVVPAVATAKLDIRLVPGQDPDRVYRLLEDWAVRQIPPSLHFTLKKLMAMPAVSVPLLHPAVQSARSALQSVYKKEPVFIKSGGTVPIVHLLQSLLGMPTVLLGFGLPQDRVHAPNERFYLPNFFKGISTVIQFMHHYKETSKS